MCECGCVCLGGGKGISEKVSGIFPFDTICVCLCVSMCVCLRVCVSLQGSIEERLKQLQDAHRDFGPGSQHFLSSKRPLPGLEVAGLRCITLEIGRAHV